MITARLAGALLLVVVAGACDSGTAPQLSPVVTRVSPDRGPLAGGTNVTISGASFIDITDVSFGGVELVGMTVVSKTTITGTTPPGSHTGAEAVVVTSEHRGSGRCPDCFRYTQFPGPLELRLSAAPTDSAVPLGALLISVTGGPLSGVTASGPAIPWSSVATTPAHLIVRGDLMAGSVLATIAVPDTQEAVRQRYSVSVRQATARSWTRYQQLNAADYVVAIAPAQP